MHRASLRQIGHTETSSHSSDNTFHRDVPESAWRWPNFSPAEIACRGTGKLLINEPALDRLQALPTGRGSKVLFENDRLRVLGVTLEPSDEEPVHVFDSLRPPVADISPSGQRLAPSRDVIRALAAWNGQGCLVVQMAPQPPGRVLNASDLPVHGIRI